MGTIKDTYDILKDVIITAYEIIKFISQKLLIQINKGFYYLEVQLDDISYYVLSEDKYNYGEKFTHEAGFKFFAKCESITITRIEFTYSSGLKNKEYALPQKQVVQINGTDVIFDKDLQELETPHVIGKKDEQNIYFLKEYLCSSRQQPSDFLTGTFVLTITFRVNDFKYKNKYTFHKIENEGSMKLITKQSYKLR